MSKIARDPYYMTIALATAKRGTCDRRQVGAVLVHHDRILSTGFNGAPRGLPECDVVGHDLSNGSCIRTVHAEQNALLEIGASRLRTLAQQAQKFARGAPVLTLYTTTSPCRVCMDLAINSHVQRIVYLDKYSSPTHDSDRAGYAFEVAKQLGISMESLSLGTD